MSDENSSPRASLTRCPGRAAELYRGLSRDLALLIRLELQSTASRHAGRLRLVKRELALLLIGLAALVFAAMVGSWALVRVLELDVRGWLAALCVAAAWALVAVASLITLSRARRRRTRKPLAADLSAERARAESDAAARMEELVDLLAEKLARHEEGRVARAARHDLEWVEHEVQAETSALEELVEIVTLPGRAGIDAIRRLVS